MCPASARNTALEERAMSERREIINSRTQIYQFDNKWNLSSHRLGAGLPAAPEMYGSPFKGKENKWYTQNYIRYSIKCISFVLFACSAGYSFRIQMDFAIPKLVRRLFATGNGSTDFNTCCQCQHSHTHTRDSSPHSQPIVYDGSTIRMRPQQKFAFSSTKLSIQINHTF